MGGNETNLIELIQRMADRLKSRSYPNLELMTHVLEGEGHASAYAASLSRALCMLYNPDWMIR
jgi:hypothetical protein